MGKSLSLSVPLTSCCLTQGHTWIGVQAPKHRHSLDVQAGVMIASALRCSMAGCEKLETVMSSSVTGAVIDFLFVS